MATLPESVDYTDKDFDALRARLIALIKSVFPDWTDFDVASFGNVLVELYAYVGDVLTFYQDNAPSTAHNSFAVSANLNLAVEWDIPVTSATAWKWAQVATGRRAPAYLFTLSDNNSFVRFHQREDAVKLDRIVVTNDPGFVPVDVSIVNDTGN